MNWNLNLDKKELLATITRKDLRIDTFRAGGAGGQHQNKTSSGARITHPASGAVGESRTSRHQHENKKAAFKRMTEHWRFRLWIDKQFAAEDIEQTTSRRYTYKGSDISLDARKMDRE